MNIAAHVRRGMRPVNACLIVVALLTTGSVSGACANVASDRSATPASHASMSPTHSTVPPTPDARSAAWAARPAYTGISDDAEAAYHYALHHPNLLEWIPCYCGCGPIGHGSNLDCYFEPRTSGAIAFEEHASYCRICIDITLRAKQLADAGTSLPGIRSAIDAEFGGSGGGTDTRYPV